MLQVHISPVGVQKIIFAANDAETEAADLYAYQAIRPLLDQINSLLYTVALEISAQPTKNAREDVE